MQSLQKQLDEIKQWIEKGDVLKSSVSKASSYWQIDHGLKVINRIPKTLETSNPDEYAPNFNITKLLIMTFKKIPRGKGKAPKQVLPEKNITKSSLKAQLQIAMHGLNILDNLDANCHFKHPYFGHLNVKESKKFLAIHTEHHLKIVREIMKH